MTTPYTLTCPDCGGSGCEIETPTCFVHPVRPIAQCEGNNCPHIKTCPSCNGSGELVIEVEQECGCDKCHTPRSLCYGDIGPCCCTQKLCLGTFYRPLSEQEVEEMPEILRLLNGANINICNVTEIGGKPVRIAPWKKVNTDGYAGPRRTQ